MKFENNNKIIDKKALEETALELGLEFKEQDETGSPAGFYDENGRLACTIEQISKAINQSLKQYIKPEKRKPVTDIKITKEPVFILENEDTQEKQLITMRKISSLSVDTDNLGGFSSKPSFYIRSKSNTDRRLEIDQEEYVKAVKYIAEGAKNDEA